MTVIVVVVCAAAVIVRRCNLIGHFCFLSLHVIDNAVQNGGSLTEPSSVTGWVSEEQNNADKDTADGSPPASEGDGGDGT